MRDILALCLKIWHNFLIAEWICVADDLGLNARKIVSRTSFAENNSSLWYYNWIIHRKILLLTRINLPLVSYLIVTRQVLSPVMPMRSALQELTHIFKFYFLIEELLFTYSLKLKVRSTLNMPKMPTRGDFKMMSYDK